MTSKAGYGHERVAGGTFGFISTGTSRQAQGVLGTGRWLKQRAVTLSGQLNVLGV